MKVKAGIQKLKPDSVDNIKSVVDSFEPEWNHLKAADTSELFMDQMKTCSLDVMIREHVQMIQSDLDTIYEANYVELEGLKEEKVDLDLKSID